MSCEKKVSAGLYDRQIQTELFKRFHGTNFMLKPKILPKKIGPTSYDPKTIEEIFRGKTFNKFASFYRQPAKRKTTSRCSSNGKFLSSIPDEILREKEFQRRFNSIRLDRQSSTRCRQLSSERTRAPPVTLYEKTSFTDELRHKQTGIYGPYVQLGQDRSHSLPEWYKGPSRQPTRTMLEVLFSSANRYKGKFSPSPRYRNSKIKTHHSTSSPGPTRYFENLFDFSHSNKKFSRVAFLSSSERFSNLKTGKSSIGPAQYNPQSCRQRCSK